MKTLNNLLQITIAKPKDSTKSGLTVAGAKEKRLEQGKVISVGKDVEEVKKGDTVIFKQFSTDTVELEGKEFSFIKESDILAVL